MLSRESSLGRSTEVFFDMSQKRKIPRSLNTDAVTISALQTPSSNKFCLCDSRSSIQGGHHEISNRPGSFGLVAGARGAVAAERHEQVRILRHTWPESEFEAWTGGRRERARHLLDVLRVCPRRSHPVGLTPRRRAHPDGNRPCAPTASAASGGPAQRAFPARSSERESRIDRRDNSRTAPCTTSPATQPARFLRLRARAPLPRFWFFHTRIQPYFFYSQTPRI